MPGEAWVHTAGETVPRRLMRRCNMPTVNDRGNLRAAGRHGSFEASVPSIARRNPLNATPQTRAYPQGRTPDPGLASDFLWNYPVISKCMESRGGTEAQPGTALEEEVAERASPRVAVVVVGSSPEMELRPWLDPIASLGAARGFEVVVVGAGPTPDTSEWGPHFARIRFIHSAGDLIAQRRAGAEATRADVLLFTEYPEAGAYRRLVTLTEALGPRNEG